MTAPIKINPKTEHEWIDKEDVNFLSLFINSICYIEDKTKQTHTLFDSISNISTDKEKIKEFAQYYTPSDVALYTAYQLLKNFSVSEDKVFDPCVGKGSLLIASGAVLALRYGLRGRDLLHKIYGTEICSITYNETLDNIINGLSQWIDGVSKIEAKKILSKQIKNIDFFSIKIPSNSLMIVNPPYKEVSKKGNMWLGFAEEISNNKNVKSFGMIVPISICSSDRAYGIRTSILQNYDEIIAFHHDTRPRPLFKNIEQRISIVVAHKSNNKKSYKTTGYLGHNAGNRASIWKNEYISIDTKLCTTIFPKLSKDEFDFFTFHFNPKYTLLKNCTSDDTIVWIRTTGRYSLLAQYEKPETITSKWRKIEISKHGAEIIIKDFKDGTALKWWKIFGDGRDLSIKKFLSNYGIDNAK